MVSGSTRQGVCGLFSSYQHVIGAIFDQLDTDDWQRDICLDGQAKAWSYAQLFSLSMSAYQCYELASQQKIGVLLPNHPTSLSVLFGVWLSDCSAAMLNVTAGLSGLQAACQVANVRIVISSRAFLERVGMDGLIGQLPVQWLWLEDIPYDGHLCLPETLGSIIHTLASKAEDEAVVLFTSGSEGMPKGVSLSHRNLLVNVEQTCDRLHFTKQDRFFIALPIFHTFGLTVGCLLPLLRKINVCLFPSPLQVKAIPSAIHTHRSTILFGSSTFLWQWGRQASEEEMKSLRMVIAGAEKLQPQVRAWWQEHFAIDILEGYGVTETSPVIAVNTPEDNRHGSVGKLVEGMLARVVPVDGLEYGGRLQVKGNNVMRGYYLAERPGVVTPLQALFNQDGWYDTGDLAAIDTQGYIRILGRAKRFAKIGGEMVSVEISEQLAKQLYPDGQHASVAVPDAQKGESIVLVTTVADFSRAVLLQAAKAQGIPELALPKRFMHVESLPLLASGKLDLVRLASLAQQF